MAALKASISALPARRRALIKTISLFKKLASYKFKMLTCGGNYVLV